MIIALNNKSNLTKEEFSNYLEELKKIKTEHTIILIPTFLNISEASKCDILLGSQNVSTTESGAYTGEISAKQLKSYGVSFALVGHSERRQNQKETLLDIEEKIKRLLEVGITPILCIGETEEERNLHQVTKVLKEELLSATNDLSPAAKSKILIAYEPIWSIGTGKIPTKEEIIEVFTFIKNMFPHNKVLYGGSANEQNIDMLKEISLIDGYLLGGLSLHPEKLQQFIEKLH